MAEDEIRNLMDDTARRMMEHVSGVPELSSMLIFLCESLESEVFERGLDESHPEGFELVLERLRDALSDRLAKHEW